MVLTWFDQQISDSTPKWVLWGFGVPQCFSSNPFLEGSGRRQVGASKERGLWPADGFGGREKKDGHPWVWGVGCMCFSVWFFKLLRNCVERRSFFGVFCLLSRKKANIWSLKSWCLSVIVSLLESSPHCFCAFCLFQGKLMPNSPVHSLWHIFVDLLH